MERRREAGRVRAAMEEEEEAAGATSNSSTSPSRELTREAMTRSSTFRPSRSCHR